MIHLFNFYHEKSKKFFLSSLLLILTSYFVKYVFQVMMPESQWKRWPIIFSFIAAVVLSWRINQLDVQSNHQTLASTTTQSTLEKIMARYVLSYVQVVVVCAINLVFNFTIVSLSLIQLLFIALELAVYLAGMVSYLILLRGVVAKLWLPNVSKNVIVAIGWILILLMNEATRLYFPKSIDVVLTASQRDFYPSTFILNACLSAAIVFVYLWLEKNQLNNN
jgi:magnesium-transporting ATPase (P-type)